MAVAKKLSNTFPTWLPVNVVGIFHLDLDEKSNQTAEPDDVDAGKLEN